MKRRWLIIILLVSALLRGGLLAAAWHSPQGLFTPDSVGYWELRGSLAENSCFQRDNQPEIFRTPGYPFFLLLGDLFSCSNASWSVAVAVQIVLDVLLVYVTYLLGSYLIDDRVGLWAAGLQAISVVAIVSSVRILSDGIFALLFVVSMLLLVNHLKTGRWWSLTSSAVVIAIACYFRPIGLTAAVIFTMVLLLGEKKFRRAGAFAGIVIAFLSPWVIRNAVVADYYGFSSFATDSMYYYSAVEIVAAEGGGDAEAVRMARRRQQADFARTGVTTAGQDARFRSRDAFKTILSDPLTYAKIHLKGSLATLLPGITDILEVLGVTTGQRGTLKVLHNRGLITAVRHYFGENLWAFWLCAPLVMLLGLKYLLAMICAAAKLRIRMSRVGWLILFTMGSFAFAGGPGATPRYRVPIEPLINVAAAIGLATVLNWLFQRKKDVQRIV